VSPCLGGFEGFDLTNLRGQFGGEKFHLFCSKLGLGDAILHPHHSTSDLLSCRRVLHQPQVHEERGRTIEGFQQRGAHHSLREVRSKRLEGLREILAPGFSL
jgi:hypothetical protein